MERGSGTEVIMTQVELQARLKEQREAKRESLLKYRGVAYKRVIK